MITFFQSLVSHDSSYRASLGIQTYIRFRDLVMTSQKPHFLLFCDGNVSANGESAGSQRGRWRFVLEDLVSGERVEATDQESACAPDRSALVAVLRGLEALEQPSKVTLITTSRYVTRGLQYGLSEWRDNDYSWEHFGAVQPIRNADIWKRIDRALAYHQVQCRWMANDAGAESPEEAPATLSQQTSERNDGESSVGAKVVNTQVAKPAEFQNTSKRSKTIESNRTIVSTTKYQRIYVDTPIPNAGPSSERTPNMQNSERNFGQKNNSRRIRFSIPLYLVHLLMLPFRLACRCPVWLCSRVWDGILAIDVWLESHLRCLLLLDPGKRPTRY